MRLLVLVMLSTTAHAETSPFVTLDRTIGVTNVGLQIGLMRYYHDDGDGSPNQHLTSRAVLHGQVALSPNVGLVASTNVVWYSPDEDHPGEHSLGFGSSHLGGYLRLPSEHFELVGHVALALPTATSFDDAEDRLARENAIHSTRLPWLQERTVGLDATWVHAGGTMRYRTKELVVQIDGYVDFLPFTVKVEAKEPSSNAKAPVRLHLGGGAAWVQDVYRLGAELLLSGYSETDALPVDLASDAGYVLGATASAAHVAGDGWVTFWFQKTLTDVFDHAFGFGYQQAL